MKALRHIGLSDLGGIVGGPECPRLAVDFVAEPQENEDKIARYLETAPSYAAAGKIVGDVLNPDEQVVLFPGAKTDGVFSWAAELYYYVRKYHLRVPTEFIEHMALRNWIPPTEDEVDWKALFSH